jgi:aryl-alcohol dehydrogenase-like predicted oxidoreductase
MEYRNLGNSPLKVSLAGIGCNNFGMWIDEPQSKIVIHKALDLGITLFDTADAYGKRGGSETIMGNILGARRKDIVLATKFGLPMSDDARPADGSRAYVMSAVEASLKRLKTDWIDLYQYHRPDPETPLEETLRAMDDLVKSGKVRFIGCSNMPAAQMRQAHDISKSKGLAPFISCQDEYSLVFRDVEKELIPAAQELGMGLLPYFPLAGGLLTGKYKRGEKPVGTRMENRQDFQDRFLNEKNFQRVEKLEAFVKSKNRTLLELAFSWLAARPTVASVIAGATKPEQLEKNVAAVNWKLTPDDIAEIDALSA